VGSAVAVLLLLLLLLLLWRRRRARASTTAKQQPNKSHSDKQSVISGTPLPAADNAAGDGHAAISLPVLWQPPSSQQHTTNRLSQPPDFRQPTASYLHQLPPFISTSLTSPAATSITRATTTATIPTRNSSSSGRHSHMGSGGARGLVISPAASADMTALLDAHALGQMRIDWSDIKLAEKPLGRGGFGAVYRGSWQGIKVAVKMLEGVSTSAVGDLRREALMMSRVRHPGIAVVYGLAIADSEQQAASNGHAPVALIMK
jgi:hypothetical protein